MNFCACQGERPPISKDSVVRGLATPSRLLASKCIPLSVRSYADFVDRCRRLLLESVSLSAMSCSLESLRVGTSRQSIERIRESGHRRRRRRGGRSRRDRRAFFLPSKFGDGTDRRWVSRNGACCRRGGRSSQEWLQEPTSTSRTVTPPAIFAVLSGEGWK